MDDCKIRFEGTPQELSEKDPKLWKEWVNPSIPRVNKNSTHRERFSLRRQVSKISLQHISTLNRNNSVVQSPTLVSREI